MEQTYGKNDIYKCRVNDGGVRGNFGHDLPTQIFAYTHNVFCPTAMSQPLLIRQTQRCKHFPHSCQQNVNHKESALQLQQFNEELFY